MPKQTYIQRFSLIIRRLEKGPATFDQVAKYLEDNSAIQGHNFSFSQRTFQRDIQDIYAQLGYEIVNEKTGDRRYFIKEKPEEGEYSERLLDAYEEVNLVKAAQENSQHILFETRKAKGLEHFSGLLHAIKNKKITSFTHYKYWDDTTSQRTVHPLALKESRGRWYLICVEPALPASAENPGKIKTFGLDRISELDISKTSYREKYAHDIKALFVHSFGVANDNNNHPQKIRLAFTYEQGQYIRTYPLHHSQQVIKENHNELIVELHVGITYDLIMELLSYGGGLRVLSPVSLVKQVKKILSDSLENYTSKK